jgi:hypothetical protein
VSFELNLDGVDAWSGSVILRAGNHPVTVVSEEIKKPGDENYDSDHVTVMLQLEAIGGDEPGAELRDWVHITEKTKGRIVQIYTAFGIEIPKGNFQWIPLQGRNAKVLVREEPSRKDPAKTVSVVKSYQRLTDDDLAVTAVQTSFDAKPVEDDLDIPF